MSSQRKIPVALSAALCAALVAPRADAANPLLFPLRAMKAGAATIRAVGKASLGAAARGDLLGAAGHVNPINVALIGYQKLTAPDANPGKPKTWARSFGSGSERQRGMVDDHGRLYMRTEVDVARPAVEVAPRAEVALRGAWTRFGYGGSYRPLSPAEYRARTGRAAAPDAVTYELDPPAVWNRAPSGLIRVNEQLRTHAHGGRMRGTLRLDGHVVGRAHVGVAPRGDGAVLTGGFDGVEIGGYAKLLGPATMGAMHGAVEAQGFSSLARQLER